MTQSSSLLDPRVPDVTIPVMPGPEEADSQLISNRVTSAIARYRLWLFAFIAFMMVIPFNGRWRLGLDSAHYRGLAMGVATGKGYSFNDWAAHQVYPGLPWLLGSVEYVFGPADRTPSAAEQKRILGPSAATSISLLVILAMGMGAVIFSYKVIRLHYPEWVATVIAFCVGTNAVFLQHCHEFLTDVPFLFGVVVSLYGWELLKRADTRGSMIRAIVIAIFGLLVAASMRPTFWVLAVSWGLVCIWGLITGPRKLHAICLAILLVAWVSMIIVDPRFKGINPLAGGYEREAIEVIPSRLMHGLSTRLLRALRDQFPPAVFGEAMSPLSIPVSIILLGSGLFLFRKHTLWALMIWVMFAITVVISSVPRYYMMVLPPLLLGWLYCCSWVARRLPARWGEAVLCLGLALVVVQNLTASLKFIVEQRQTQFFREYRNGAFLPTMRWAALIRKHVPAGQEVIGPTGGILSLLSGRHVYTQKELFPRGVGSSSPKALAAKNVKYAIFPSKLYTSKEREIHRMIKKGVIVPGRRVVGGPRKSWMAELIVNVPETNWRKLPNKPAATRPAKIVKKPTTRRKPR